MKIGLAQINFIIGDFNYNAQCIIDSVDHFEKQGCDLVVFSELSVCGYPPLDLLENKSFIEHCEQSILRIAEHCTGIAAIVGGPKLNAESAGKNLFNAAYFLHNGQVEKIVYKTLLPTYDIFDEYRYFETNKVFELITYKGEKIALTICEDLWYKQPLLTQFGKDKLYTISPMQELSMLKPDLLINIAASPFSYEHEIIKQEIFTYNAKKYTLPLIYVNQIGANTELIFDGASMAVNNKGEIVAKLGSFKEDKAIIHTKEINNLKPVGPLEPERKEDDRKTEHIHEALILGIRDYFTKIGFKIAVIGLSGGIDSAVTLVLAAKALGPENVKALLMPSKYSSEHSVTDAVKLAENLSVPYEIINIETMVAAFDKALKSLFEGTKPDITEENIQSRIRGILLMAISNKFGNILLNTSNKSESAVGYGTLYGDMAGGLSVIGDVYKSYVYKLARYINKSQEVIPENTIIKPPSAELKPDQKDTDSLPDYNVLDAILFNYIELRKSVSDIVSMGFDKKLVRSVIKLVNTNEYKRYQTPPILRISFKAFGLGRRIPIVARYNWL